MNRREFLKMAGAVVGALALPAELLKKKEPEVFSYPFVRGGFVGRDDLSRSIAFGGDGQALPSDFYDGHVRCRCWPMVYFVDPANGDDSNSGIRVDEAFATWQHGIDSTAYGAGDTVILLPEGQS